MSWYYSINGGFSESKDGQSLRSFLSDVAAYLSDNDDYSFTIKELTLRYDSALMGDYDLPVEGAQSYLDSLLAEYESEAAEIAYYGTWAKQVQSDFRASRF